MLFICKFVFLKYVRVFFRNIFGRCWKFDVEGTGRGVDRKVEFLSF